MMDFMSILVKHIFKTLLKTYDGFCVMMDFPYELFVLVKRSPGRSTVSMACSVSGPGLSTVSMACSVSGPGLSTVSMACSVS